MRARGEFVPLPQRDVIRRAARPVRSQQPPRSRLFGDAECQSRQEEP